MGESKYVESQVSIRNACLEGRDALERAAVEYTDDNHPRGEVLNKLARLLNDNADLLGAAPELLEAMESILRMLDDQLVIHNISNCKSIARAAIAKATGAE